MSEGFVRVLRVVNPERARARRVAELLGYIGLAQVDVDAGWWAFLQWVQEHGRCSRCLLMRRFAVTRYQADDIVAELVIGGHLDELEGSSWRVVGGWRPQERPEWWSASLGGRIPMYLRDLAVADDDELEESSSWSLPEVEPVRSERDGRFAFDRQLREIDRARDSNHA